jgi:hypothetical protein
VAEINLFKWRHYESEIILLCVRRYLRYALSYRGLEEMMSASWPPPPSSVPTQLGDPYMITLGSPRTKRSPLIVAPTLSATPSPSICLHVMQADKGADLDFLVGRSGVVVNRESH